MAESERLLVFVRHGEAVSSQDVWDADDQRPLTEKGESAAQRVAKEVAAFRPERLYSSPSLRARQTAARIAERIGMEPELEPGLLERTFHSLEGLSLDEIAVRHGPAVLEAVHRRNTDDLVIDGDESFAAAVQRGRESVERLVSGSYRRVVAVSHGGPHCWAVSALCGIAPGARMFQLAEAHLTVLAFRLTSGGRPELSRIVAINTASLPTTVRCR
ncbi:histidine phosphatase family protein [Nocardiopsis sp. LOL_012]|uniref:histidine phosphatase family protein n=1 Tax=Nocardiopsis sp. LOL_012 TaxID=3345409 RepID=UPI003A8804C4